MPGTNRAAREHGLITAVVLLFLIVFSAVQWAVPLHSPRPARADAVTRAALAEARLALLGYAASYPDRVNSKFGPGYLPCPARSEDGIAAPACADSTGSTLGRLPWHTLRTNDLRDGSGNGLWYAVAQTHRYNPKHEPLNSNLIASLAVDDSPVVAVIVAPHGPLSGQARRWQHARDAAQFVESRVAGRPATFTRTGHPDVYNDRLLPLTRRDLMWAVEARAGREIAHRLAAYRERHQHHYPWLLAHPFTPDALPATPYRQARGWLPFHYFDAGHATYQAQTFATAISLSWTLRDLLLSRDDPHALIPPACLHQAPCELGGALLTVQGPAQCRWWSPDPSIAPARVAACEFERQFEFDGGQIRYRLSFMVVNDLPEVTTRGPDGTRWRTRRIRSTEPGADDIRHNMLSIDITVTATDERAGTAALVARRATGGEFIAEDIRYAPDVNAGELPAWLVKNEWLSLMQIAWAPSDCALHGDCLQLVRQVADDERAPPRAIRALVLGAGPPLSGQRRAADAPLSAWFEDSHADEAVTSARFVLAPVSAAFNDRVFPIEDL